MRVSACRALPLTALVMISCAVGGLFATPTPDATPTPTVTPTPLLPTASPTPSPTPLPEFLAHLRDGDRALINGDWDAANANYQAALNLAPDAEAAQAALIGLGQTRLRSGDVQDAIGAFNTYLQKYPDAVRAADAHFWLGEAYRAQGTWG
ncbi:MAG: tetratricopeptide repeat protein, partial [Chloroflexi bacterium]|nr:tetratricopeptide repeat protein [Chloroflexota bacterium]